MYTLMKHYGPMTPHYLVGRKQPLWYTDPYGSIAILGAYETACGGCDTISGTEQIFSYIRELHALDYHVLYEGLMLAMDVKWISQLHADGLPVLAVALDTPLDICLAGVNARRQAKDPTKGPVNPENTESKWHGVQKSIPRLRALNVPVVVVPRSEAPNVIIKTLHQLCPRS
jgi:hypothetical protein